MLLALRSLWEQEAAGGDVIVTGIGVASNPQIGVGQVLIRTGTVGGFIKRPRKPRRIGHIDFVSVPVDLDLVGEGVRASPHVSRGAVIIDSIIRGEAVSIDTYQVGAGEVIIKVDFSDEELVALLMAA